MLKHFIGVGVCTLCLTAQAQSIGGSVVQEVEMDRSQVITGDVSVRSAQGGGGRDVNIQTIKIGPKANIRGTVYQQAKMKDALIIAGSNSNVQSILIGQ